jgi:hypothetical protein
MEHMTEQEKDQIKRLPDEFSFPRHVDLDFSKQPCGFECGVALIYAFKHFIASVRRPLFRLGGRCQISNIFKKWRYDFRRENQDGVSLMRTILD